MRERGLILIPWERGWTATRATTHPPTGRVELPDVGTLTPAPDALTAVLHALLTL
jgi:Holliday junction resolvase